jgi:cytosine/uracil/thiamine/allantoin permease
VPAFEEVNGKYWYSGGFYWAGLIAWAIGVIAFVLLHNLAFLKATTGATYPVLILSGLLYWLFSRIHK